MNDDISEVIKKYAGIKAVPLEQYEEKRTASFPDFQVADNDDFIKKILEAGPKDI